MKHVPDILLFQPYHRKFSVWKWFDNTSKSEFCNRNQFMVAPSVSPLLTLTSYEERLNFPLISKWSIWFDCSWRWYPCGLMNILVVPPTTRLLCVTKVNQQFAILILLSKPSLPITCSKPWLSLPVFINITPSKKEKVDHVVALCQQNLPIACRNLNSHQCWSHLLAHSTVLPTSWSAKCRI